MHHITSKLHRSHTLNGESEKDHAAARERERKRLLDWHVEKKPLDYDQILVDPGKKMVGHSSKVLRYEDFELIKTLGTGMFYCCRCCCDAILRVVDGVWF